MKRINYFYLFLAAITCMIVLRAQSDKPRQDKLQKTTSDTLKIPALYILISREDFQKMADTSWMIMQDYGIEKSGSQIRTDQETMTRQWRTLFFKYARPDTIRVVKGGKP